MSGIVGNQWELSEELSVINFSSPRPIDSNKVNEIKKALESDKNLVPRAQV